MKYLTISFLGAMAFAAAAQASEPVQPAAGTTPQQAAEPATPGDATCLRHTGSRITRSTDRKDAATGKAGKPRCTGYGRSYTRDELDRTGQTNVADALRLLDPSVH